MQEDKQIIIKQEGNKKKKGADVKGRKKKSAPSLSSFLLSKALTFVRHCFLLFRRIGEYGVPLNLF